jgi:predicted HAD superfamily phosphohydrolase
MKNFYLREGVLDEAASGSGAPPAAQDTPPASQDAPAVDPLPDFLKDVKDPDVINGVSMLRDFKDVGTLAKSYVHAKQFIGKDKVAIPSKHADEKEWNDVLKKLGLPETVDKYELAKDKDSMMDDAFFGNLKTSLHKAGVLPRQAGAIAKFMDEHIKKGLDSTKETLAAYEKESESKLQKEWGESFIARASLAKDVVKNFGDDEFKTYIKERGLQSDYHLVKFLSKIGEKMNGDHIAPRGDNSSSFSTPANAMEELNELRVTPAAMDNSHPNHQHVMNQMEKLAKLAYSQK